MWGEGGIATGSRAGGFALAKRKSWGCRGSLGWALLMSNTPDPGINPSTPVHPPRRSRSCAGSTSRSAGTGRRWRGTTGGVHGPATSGPGSPGMPAPTPPLLSPQAGGAEQDPAGVAGGAPPRHPPAQDLQAVSGLALPRALPPPQGDICLLQFDFCL